MAVLLRRPSSQQVTRVAKTSESRLGFAVKARNVEIFQTAFLASPTGRGLYEDAKLRSDRQALALAQHLGMRPIVAGCHVGLGRLYRQDDAGPG